MPRPVLARTPGPQRGDTQGDGRRELGGRGSNGWAEIYQPGSMHVFQALPRTNFRAALTFWKLSLTRSYNPRQATQMKSRKKENEEAENRHSLSHCA